MKTPLNCPARLEDPQVGNLEFWIGVNTRKGQNIPLLAVGSYLTGLLHLPGPPSQSPLDLSSLHISEKFKEIFQQVAVVLRTHNQKGDCVIF